MAPSATGVLTPPDGTGAPSEPGRAASFATDAAQVAGTATRMDRALAVYGRIRETVPTGAALGAEARKLIGAGDNFLSVLQVRPSNVFCYVPFIGQVTYSSVAVDARSPLAYMRQTCLEDARPQIGPQEGALHDPISPDPENADG